MTSAKVQWRPYTRLKYRPLHALLALFKVTKLCSQLDAGDAAAAAAAAAADDDDDITVQEVIGHSIPRTLPWIPYNVNSLSDVLLQPQISL